jgi:hypothetical protein
VALSQARILYQNHSGDYPQVILTIPVTCRTTVNVTSESYKQKTFFKIAIAIKIYGSRIRIRIKKRNGSADPDLDPDPDPDPHQNVMAPQHWFKPQNNKNVSRVFILIFGAGTTTFKPQNNKNCDPGF